MKLSIISPESTLYEGEATSVKFPGTAGQFEVLENHAPLISTLEKGKIRVRTAAGKDEFIDIEQGFVEVLKNKVTVMV
ncbi:MAG: ATP synthase F1 subunit epsilon [Bacteroidetes bacterium]|nr:ATP synthase F1 subunit epsilon [Bacteroidota bacterium]